jgi:hypothetical protein
MSIDRAIVRRYAGCVLAVLWVAGLASAPHGRHVHGGTDEPGAHPECPVCVASTSHAILPSSDVAPFTAIVVEMPAAALASPTTSSEKLVPPGRGPPLLS